MSSSSSSSSPARRGVKRSSAFICEPAPEAVKRRKLEHAPPILARALESGDKKMVAEVVQRFITRAATREVTSEWEPKRGFTSAILHNMEKELQHTGDVADSTANALNSAFHTPFLRNARRREAARVLALAAVTPDNAINRATKRKLFEPRLFGAIMQFFTFQHHTVVRTKTPSRPGSYPSVVCVDEVADELLVVHTPSGQEQLMCDVYSIKGKWLRSFGAPISLFTSRRAVARNRLMYTTSYGGIVVLCTVTGEMKQAISCWVLSAECLLFVPGHNALLIADRFRDRCETFTLDSAGRIADGYDTSTLGHACYIRDQAVRSWASVQVLQHTESGAFFWSPDTSQGPPARPLLSCNDWFVCERQLLRRWDDGFLSYPTDATQCLSLPTAFSDGGIVECVSEKHNLLFYVDIHVHAVQLPRRESETAY